MKTPRFVTLLWIIAIVLVCAGEALAGWEDDGALEAVIRSTRMLGVSVLAFICGRAYERGVQPVP